MLFRSTGILSEDYRKKNPEVGTGIDPTVSTVIFAVLTGVALRVSTTIIVGNTEIVELLGFPWELHVHEHEHI